MLIHVHVYTYKPGYSHEYLMYAEGQFEESGVGYLTHHVRTKLP